MTLTPRQLAAARALIGWSQHELATRAGVGFSTVSDFERGARRLRLDTERAIRAVIREAGVTLIPGGAQLADGTGVYLKEAADA